MRVLLAAAVCFTVITSVSCAPRPLGSKPPLATPTDPPAAQATASAAHGGPPQTRRAPRLPVSAAPTPSSQSASVAQRNRLASGLLDGVLPDPNTDYGVVLEDLASGAQTAVNADMQFASASLYKLGVAWLVLREVDAQVLSLDAPLTIEAEDAVEAEPDGGVAGGDTPSVRDALEAMLSLSSNAAAHAFLRVLGRSSLNQEMQRLGLTQTRVPDDDLPVTSAADMARLLRLIATSPELNASSREVLMQCLANDSPPDALRDTLPESVDIADKTGNLEDASNVGALLASTRATVILVVLDHGVDPGDARGVIAQAGQIAYRALLQ
jgi:beta-lactamase class A